MSMKKFLAIFCFLFATVTFAKEKDNVSLVPERTILIAGPIQGAMYQPTIEAMEKLAATGKDIDMIISSPGGEVIAGSLIIDYMEQLKFSGVRFRCVVRDVAASMAFQILLHCNERHATPHSYLLWHPVRIFYRGALTGEMASSLGVQLAIADEVALHDLYAYLTMPEQDMLWHFQHETLHQALTLMHSAPGFFTSITNSVINLYPDKPALDTSAYGSLFGVNQLIYIHERFVSTEGEAK
jgi:ATP-dependent protease ClpP protease subunit